MVHERKQQRRRGRPVQRGARRDTGQVSIKFNWLHIEGIRRATQAMRPEVTRPAYVRAAVERALDADVPGWRGPAVEVETVRVPDGAVG